MKNRKAVELFNILNGLTLEPKSKREYAASRTMRNMADFITFHTDKMSDLDDEHAATYKNEHGCEIFLREKIKKTSMVEGKEVVEESEGKLIFTKDNQKKLIDAKRKFNDEEAPKFTIYSTTDDAGLKPYEREALIDLGFIKVEEKDEEKKAE
jgi:hypothetical protein